MYKRSLSVRAIADRNVVEVFVGHGRGIYTSAVNISAVAAPGAFLTAHLPVTLMNSSAYEMGCCWKASQQARLKTTDDLATLSDQKFDHAHTWWVVAKSGMIHDHCIRIEKECSAV